MVCIRNYVICYEEKHLSKVLHGEVEQGVLKSIGVKASILICLADKNIFLFSTDQSIYYTIKIFSLAKFDQKRMMVLVRRVWVWWARLPRLSSGSPSTSLSSAPLSRSDRQQHSLSFASFFPFILNHF